MTAKRVAPELSDAPWAVPIGVSTEVGLADVSRGHRALRMKGESLQSSVFQTKGGKDGWAGRATAEEARRSAETRDWMPTMVLWEMGGEKRRGKSSRGRVSPKSMAEGAA